MIKTSSYMKINRKNYMNKVYACWIGKNIGGTIGGPFEGEPNMMNITGFTTPKGEPVPNDDLDMQLLWLEMIEHRGIRNVNPLTLSEYWLSFVPADFNEYGTAKANLENGILPPYSGECHNSMWKTSNGAWIRTEIWACLFPGFPELAARYAFYDGCVDHGCSEGTNAAMFIAALESAAFYDNNIRNLIDKALTFIPRECLVAKSVLKAIEFYDNKMPIEDAREEIVNLSKELGMFQAPANIGFVILGLMYGEGNYKKSMLCAVNCGDDTDCTAATIGSIMGIMNGMNYIPEDWKDFIGDNIHTITLDISHPFFPKTCTELTNRIAELMPSAFKAYQIYTEYTDGETELDTFPSYLKVVDYPIPETGNSVYIPDLIYAKGYIEFDKPVITPGEDITLKFVFMNTIHRKRYIHIYFRIPEGWTCKKRSLDVFVEAPKNGARFSDSITFTAGEIIDSKNTIYADISSPGRPTVATVPITILG